MQQTKETQLINLQNEMKGHADNEQQRLQDVICQLEARIEEIQADSRRVIDENERAWQDRHDNVTKEALQDTKEAIQKENDMRQQALDGQH